MNMAPQNDKMTTVNKVSDYKNFVTDVNTCWTQQREKLLKIQVVVIDMEIRQHTKVTNILVRIFTMNVLTKVPEGHIATLPVTRTC